MNSATDIFQAKGCLANDGVLANFMSVRQRFTLIELLDGEEGAAIAELVLNAKKAVLNTPKTYETENIESDQKVVHLHYFYGCVDAWIIERDVDGTPLDNGLGPQLQAFGYANLYGDGFHKAECGYVSIKDLIKNNAELDLHWTAASVGDLRGR